MTMQQPPSTPPNRPTNSDTLPSRPPVPPTPAALPTPMIILSRTERMIHNTAPANAVLWTPNALHWPPAIPWPTRYHYTPATDTFVPHPANPHRRIPNPPTDRHLETPRLLTTLPLPAPDPPDSSNQTQHVPIRAKVLPTTPTRPNQQLPCLPLGKNTTAARLLATLPLPAPDPSTLPCHALHRTLVCNIKALAQNIRPP